MAQISRGRARKKGRGLSSEVDVAMRPSSFSVRDLAGNASRPSLTALGMIGWAIRDLGSEAVQGSRWRRGSAPSTTDRFRDLLRRRA